jgi:hypothetical protein
MNDGDSVRTSKLPNNIAWIVAAIHAPTQWNRISGADIGRHDEDDRTETTTKAEATGGKRIGRCISL